MNNDFSKKTRDLFDLGGWMMSWESWRNWADCLHHILTRVSNSPYNACPLNNAHEHQPEGRQNMGALSSFEVRSKYLNKTKIYLDELWYVPTEKDLKFLVENEQYYD